MHFYKLFKPLHSILEKQGLTLRIAEVVKMYYFRGDEKTTSGYLNSIPDLIIYVTKCINRGLPRAD